MLRSRGVEDSCNTRSQAILLRPFVGGVLAGITQLGWSYIAGEKPAEIRLRQSVGRDLWFGYSVSVSDIEISHGK